MSGQEPRSRSLWLRTRRDLALLATATSIAVVIWFVITDSENVTVVEPLGFALAVQAVNVPGDLAAASRIPPAQIEIAGREDDVLEAVPEDFQATVDLTGLPAGTHEIPVSVVSRNSDVTVRRVQPQSVEITLESVVTRLVQVSVEVENSPPLGFDVGEPEAAESTVSVSGVQQLVDLVDTVVARVDIGGATVDVDATVSLQARTSGGASISAVQISPSSLEVRIPIRQEIFQRAVAVTPQIAGDLAPGFRIRSVSVDPLTVVVVGTIEALEQAGSATTPPISIDNRRVDLEIRVQVLPPDGVALEDPGARVDVRVSLDTITEEAVLSVPVQLVALPTDLEARVDPARVAIRVRGPAPALAELDSTAFRVTVSAVGVPPGLRSAPVRVAFSGDLEIVSVTPAEVSLEITRLPQEEEEGETDGTEAEEAPPPDDAGAAN